MTANLIDEKKFHKIAMDIESEYQMGGLSSGLYEDYAKDILIRYLETIPPPTSPAVKGVDELEAQLNQAQNNAEIWTAIWAIYDYLKQTPVKDSQPKEVEKAKKCLQCGTHYNGGTIKFCSSDCCLKWNGMK